MAFNYPGNVKEKWRVNLKRMDGVTRTIEIDKNSTVRRLYSRVRPDLKVNWDFTGAFQLFINSTKPLVKSDSKISAIGLYDGITLIAIAQSEPYSWDLFVKLPGRSVPNTVTLHESQTCEDLYKKVMGLLNNPQPLCIRDPIGDEIPQENTNLHHYLYDGASLTTEYASYISLLVSGHSRSFIIHVPSNCFVREVFEEVGKKINVGEEVLKEMSLVTSKGYLNEYMDTRINDSEIRLSHFSHISILIRVKGGSDPRVQMLQSCPNKDVIGVQTPSIRACPFCGALVQHIDACKQMNCPACSKAFCFICLKKNEGGWQCGSWNTKCTPAPRQTHIPG